MKKARIKRAVGLEAKALMAGKPHAQAEKIEKRALKKGKK